MTTTKKDFERFKTEFLKWVDRFGLKGYRVNFRHKKLESFAEIDINETAKATVVSFTTHIDEDCKFEFSTPEANAKHEAIHLLLYRLEYLGKCRHTQSDEFNEEAEKLVRILEKVL